jgi:cytochrome c2
MNSHKINMYAGATIGSLLVFLLLGFFSDLIYVGSGHTEHEPLAFAVEIEGEETEGGHEEAAVDFAALVASADLGKGEGLFKKCKACHKLEDGVNAVGPSLWGIVGRDIASAEGYAYSGSLSDIEGTWTLEMLQAFLESPKGMAADTKMSFKGLSKVEDRVNLIVYLNEADGSPVELAAAASGEAEAPAPEAVTEAVTETTAEPATEASTETAAAESTEAAQSAEAAAGGSAFGDLLAAADADAGKKIFRKCRGCHKVEEGKNGIGPSLWGVIGRDVASIEGFAYSDAMLGKAGNWTGADLFTYLEDPKGVVPGTKMKFAGVKDPQDRANVITFLNEADGSPEPLQ